MTSSFAMNVRVLSWNKQNTLLIYNLLIFGKVHFRDAKSTCLAQTLVFINEFSAIYNQECKAECSDDWCQKNRQFFWYNKPDQPDFDFGFQHAYFPGSETLKISIGDWRFFEVFRSTHSYVSKHPLIVPTKHTVFNLYIQLLYFSYMFWCHMRHHQGEILCLLLKTRYCYKAVKCGSCSNYAIIISIL